MPANEKEFNGNLFDQLSITERFERSLNEGGEQAARREIELIRNEINRKLYQNPPIIQKMD